jgi:hypothetical protein
VAKKIRMKKIGEIEVDTGRLAIVDPCRLDEVDSFAEGQVIGNTFGGVPNHKIAVISSTGFGDGTYPVFADIEDGRVRALHIIFF